MTQMNLQNARDIKDLINKGHVGLEIKAQGLVTKKQLRHKVQSHITKMAVVSLVILEFMTTVRTLIMGYGYAKVL